MQVDAPLYLFKHRIFILLGLSESFPLRTYIPPEANFTFEW